MKSFMQSKEWEEFQKAYGRRVWRIENQLVIKYNLPLGKGYLCSFRPELNGDNLKSFLNQCRDIAKSENCIFLHSEPQNELGIRNYELGIGKSNCLQPRQTLILDISRSEDEILEQMHQKTRYNIRLAEKKGVKIRISDNPKDIDIFWRLAEKTAKRSGFHFHIKKYYQKMMEVLGQKHKILDLIIAYKEMQNSKFPPIRRAGKIQNGNEKSEILLAAIIVFYNDQRAIYLHGASNNQYRNLMAPHLAQWIAIKQAKKRRCTEYDFWGVSPLKREIPNPKSQITNKSQIPNSKIEKLNHLKLNKNLKFKIKNSGHSWSGITRFKLGFAPKGRYVEFPDCYEIPYQKAMYNLYQSYKKIRGK